MAKKKRKIIWYGRVYFHDEAPRLGCGWRGVELIRLGWKWALIREHSTGIACRIDRKMWDYLFEHPATKRVNGTAEKPKVRSRKKLR